jgi:hypothetical protein
VRALFLWILLPSFLAAFAVSAASLPATAEPPQRPVVLVLVDGLSWEAVDSEPGLQETFSDGAAATLSVVQGTVPPDDPRFGYVFLGAGSRVDTRFLPEELPMDPGRIPGAFDGPASTVRPGSLGDALERAGIQTAAVGERARLVAMNSDGDVPARARTHSSASTPPWKTGRVSSPRTPRTRGRPRSSSRQRERREPPSPWLHPTVPRGRRT